jgi:hypothetical protein
VAPIGREGLQRLIEMIVDEADERVPPFAGAWLRLLVTRRSRCRVGCSHGPWCRPGLSCAWRHRRQEFIRFLNAVERAAPAGTLIHGRMALARCRGRFDHVAARLLARQWLSRHAACTRLPRFAIVELNGIETWSGGRQWISKACSRSTAIWC